MPLTELGGEGSRRAKKKSFHLAQKTLEKAKSKNSMILAELIENRKKKISLLNSAPENDLNIN